MTDEEIISRIEAGEDSRTQFKREAVGVNDLAKELQRMLQASRFLAKLASLKLIVPVCGRGKGAYRVFGGVAR